MPLTIPSTAWSSAASSKMMFAALPPSSSVSFLPRAGELALDRLADLGRAGERDLVDARVLDERGAGAAVAGDDVDDAGRQLGLADDVAEEQRGQRRRLGRLQHDGVPGRERRRDLPREHQQREVPRDDLAGDAERLRAAGSGTRTRACRPSPRSRRSARPRAAGRRRATRGSACRRQRLEHRELARALLEDARDPEEVLRALGRRELRPAVRRTPSRAASTARSTSCGARLRDLGERLLGRRVEIVGNALAGRGSTQLAADEEAVALLERDDVARLGRGRVVPLGRCRSGACSGARARSSVDGEVVGALVAAGLLLADLHQHVVEERRGAEAGTGRASATRGRASRARARGTGSPASPWRMPPAGFIPTTRPVSS